jgi:hypothetical protein
VEEDWSNGTGGRATLNLGKVGEGREGSREEGDEEEDEEEEDEDEDEEEKEGEDEDDDEEEEEEEEGSIAERRTSSGYDDCNGATRVLPSSETS